MIGVAVVGDVLDINCWSSTPYYFYTTGERHKLFQIPWRVNVNKLKPYRYLWNIQQLLRYGQWGGFQYTPHFLRLIENQIPPSYYREVVISFNQLFPRATTMQKAGGKIYYYIDATLYNLFNSPAYNLHVPARIQQQAMAIEAENYNQCEAVVTMGQWIHDTLRQVYCLPEHKIIQILPGANFILPSNYQFSSEPKNSSKNFVLGFIGKDWKRKGLPLLLSVQQLLRRKGYPVTIKIIGNCPDELAHIEGVNYCGFINKQTQTAHFIHEISTCDVGCLFSTDEALGISVLEFLRVGVPVAGFYHQGMQDTLLEGASFRFPIDASIQTIAQTFENYINNPHLQMQMRKKAQEYSPYVSWERCIDQWKQLLNKH